MLYQQLAELPKTELHCHLDGSITLERMQTLLERKIELSDLQVSEDCESLAEYLEKFELPLQCLQTEKGLQSAGYDFIKNVAKENIKYIEVRFAPLLSVNNNLTTSKVIEAVLDGLQRGKDETGVCFNVITCAMRNHTDEQNLSMAMAAREYLGCGVCAIDLAGDEEAFPMKNFLNLFSQIKKIGMPFIIHAGECGDANNVREAINCGAKRIGHGIAMSGKKDIIKLCREKRIGIEMCPISNLQTKASQNTASYPLGEFLDAGLYVTVNTDNRTVSNSSMTKELYFIQDQYGITDSEIFRILENSIEVSFADGSLKNDLYWQLDESKKKGWQV